LKDKTLSRLSLSFLFNEVIDMCELICAAVLIFLGIGLS